MSDEAQWALITCVFLAALIVLLYFRARAHAKNEHNHIARKIDVVNKAVADATVAVDGSRQEAAIATRERRAETGYLTAMVEGSRKDAAKASEGVRTALHASDQATALEGAKTRDSTKLHLSTIFRHVVDLLKFGLPKGENHKPEESGNPDNTDAPQ